MIKDPFSAREEEIFRTLKALSGCSFVVIGGYAVNAFALPRFSVDCDIVVKSVIQLRKIEAVLLKRGYKKEKQYPEAQYIGNFLRYEKKLGNSFAVSIDILISTVTDRDTGGKFDAGWIFEDSEIMPLRGKTIQEELNLQIIKIDALIAMKIVSCRPTDIRDVFMMLPGARSLEWIGSEVSKRCSLKERVDKIIEKVSSKQFKDGLSGVYGRFDQQAFEKHRKAVIGLLK
jgi:hypothetical protein